MGEEVVTFELNDLPSFFPKCVNSSRKVDSFPSIDDDLQDVDIKEVDGIHKDESLIEILRRDDKDQLIYRSKRLFEESSNQQDFEDKENKDPEPNQSIDRMLAWKLLHLACKFDSVECAKALIEGETGPALGVNEIDRYGRTALHSAAEMLATKCIELLLHKQARTDLRSTDRNSQLALSMALSSKMMKVLWTSDSSVEDLLVILSETDLSAVRKIAEKTKEIAEVAYVIAMEGQVVSLAALVIVAPETVTGSIMVLRPDGALAFKETTTIYECLIREALSLGQKEASSRAARKLGFSNNQKRKLLLCEIELLQLFGATVPKRGSTNRKVFPPLIRASQAGDEAVVKLLLKVNIDVNEVDGEGNTALHWYLRTSSNEKKPRIVWLLLRHGAIVSQRNRVGLTPLHVAAANGNLQALQILLHQDSDSVNTVSEMKESPLFFAVKNDFLNCAELLLRYGASTQLLNLRKQRPIDLAKSQEMRFLLSQTNIFSRSSGIPVGERPTSQKDEKYVSDGVMLDEFLNVKEEPVSAERLGTVAKTEICRYFESPGGCVRGEKCLYAHGEGELLGRKLGNSELKPEAYTVRCPGPDELKRKIFIGGLPTCVDSEALGEFFEDQFGSVDDAIVIGSQAGDQVHSRGFGFVTFKNEESVAAAVQAHYVTILGKQVEVKGAVPKPILLTEVQKATPRQKHLQNQLQVLNLNDKNSGERRFDPICLPDRSFCDDSSGDPILPTWVTTFKKWLPGFLYEVSKRLKEGEWYPLSSLKGDFRATCGLELDHASLGYLKLSDFMRSFPGICRMKVVPVGGRGPATHMVLLPNILTSHHHHRFLRIPEPPMDSNLPPLHEDSGEDFRFPDDLLSASYKNFGYVGNGEGSSSGSARDEKPSQKGKDTSSGVDKRFPIVPTPNPWLNTVNKQGGGGQGDEDKFTLRKALHEESNHFSFFTREYDFYQVIERVDYNYEQCNNKEELLGVMYGCFIGQHTFFKIETYNQFVAAKQCIRCKSRKMMWLNEPCGHRLWCSECRLWAIRHAPQSMHCVVCDAKVSRVNLITPWTNADQQQQQHHDATKDLEFPPWDPKAASIKQKKKK